MPVINCFSSYAKGKTTAVLAIAAAAASSAQAADPADALAAVTSLSASATGFGPVMFGLAVTVVGIMIGVKWIKRAKGAAYITRGFSGAPAFAGALGNAKDYCALFYPLSLVYVCVAALCACVR